jgi:hypothetical protein
MNSWPKALPVILGLMAFAPLLRAHETDQFTVPPDRQFADLGDYFNRWAYIAISHGVEQANAKIREAADRHAPPTVMADLQSTSRVTMAVRNQWPWSVTQIETFEQVLRSPEMRRRYPGRVVSYGERFNGVYLWAFFPLDIRGWSHLAYFSSTVKVFGTYLGTDKFGHFTDEGISYYYAYREARDAGADERQAIAAAVRNGTEGWMSESMMLGMAGTGDYSNGDLSANFAGFLFYRNLTEPVATHGQVRPPMLVRDGMLWKLAPDIRADSGFFARFISDHLDEALNPGFFDPYMRPALRRAVHDRTAILLRHYCDENGQPRSRAWFDDKLRELSTYWGIDYGHRGSYGELVSIGGSCFGNKSVAGPVVAAKVASARSGLHMLSVGMASVQSADGFGYTPLHDAASAGDDDSVQKLLSLGADPRAKDDAGSTPLHLACRHGHLQIARLLLEHGADPNIASDAGATTLHEAALAGDVQLVRMLLARGAASVPDARGRRPADIAMDHDFADVVAVLRASTGAAH